MARKKRAPGPAADTESIVEQVVELAIRHNLAELEVEESGRRVRVVRAHAHAGAAPGARVEVAAQLPAAQPAEEVPSNLVTIEAPMVGTFYRASGPDASPFVSEGDIVKEGQVLCIIEAMKLMNEIEAEVAGEVMRIHRENGQPVQYGEPLFSIRPE